VPRIPVLLAALGLIAAPVFAQDTDPAPVAKKAEDAAPVAPWTFVYQKGEVYRFRTYVKADGRNVEDTEAITIRIRTHSKNEVKDVTEAGVATWEQLDEKMKLIINGMDIPPAANPRPVTVTFGPNGLIAKRTNPNGDPFDPSEKAQSLLASFPAPTVAVKPGESWKTEVPNPVLKNRKVTMESVFVGKDKILGLDTLKCTLKLSLPTAYGSDPNDVMQVDATYWLDATTRQLIRASFATKNALLPFPTKNMEVKLLVSRIVAGQNETEDPDGEKLIAPPAKVEEKDKG
jgi:hypothetical protein